MVDRLWCDVDGVDALASTLDAVAERARLLAGRVAEAQLVGGVLGSPVPRLGFVEETVALVGRVLAGRAGEVSALDIEPRLARPDRAAAAPVTLADLQAPLAAYGDRRVADALALARRASTDDGTRPSGRELAAALQDLTSVELDRVVRRLSVAELQAVWDRVVAPRKRGGLTDDERRDLVRFLTERIDRGVWSRLAAVVPGLEPALADVVDRLRGRYADGTEVQWTVADRQGPLAVPAVGDAAAIDDSDEKQGFLGDCYLHAALQSLAAIRPDLLARMLRRNANGTVTVVFADGTSVVVDPAFVTTTRSALTTMLTMSPDRDDAGRVGERWAAVVEKAYAAHYGGYDAIWSGRPEVAIRRLVGGTSDDLSGDDVRPAAIARRLDAGELVVLTTPNDDVEVPGRDEPLHGHHAYRIVGADPARDTVTIENPWEPGGSLPMEVAASVVAEVSSSGGGYVTSNRVPTGDEEERGGEVEERR